MKSSPKNRGVLRLSAALCALALLVGACSNDNSPQSTSSTKPGAGAPGDTEQAGIFPADTVNQAVHDGTPKRGGSITWGVESDILDVSPNQSPIQPADVQMANAVFAPLISWGDHGDFEGMAVTDNTDHAYNQLADTITSQNDDLVHWTLTLRKGAKFSNGKPVTAQQVVDATKWAMGSVQCSCAQDAGEIASVTAEDDLTVEYTLKDPIVDWPTKLVGGGLGWISESSARDAAPDPASPGIKNLIGAGAFAYASQSGDTYTVTANQHYFGVDTKNDNAKLPYLDKIVFQPLADSVTRLQAVQSGSVEIMGTADTSNLVGAKADADLRVQPAEGSSSTILVMNLTHPPFGVKAKPGETAQETAIRSLDDPTALAARQALNYAINRNEINQKYYKGTRVPSYGFFPANSPWFDAESQLPRFDAAKSKALVKKVEAAGVKMDVHSICINTPEASGVNQIIGEQMKSVGMSGEFQPVEQALLVNTLLAGGSDLEWDRSCFRSPQLADPDGVYGSIITGGPTNLVKYSRPDVDDWLNEARRTADVAERKALYDKVQEQFNSDAAVIPLMFDYWGNV
ncbi:MAG TPA: ABC transporter substrate-binding protein, partial [Acidimicrobiales bacterium]|nr:ABC transporter substrate-binding protein [Acidimicrobiales bacterium]